MAWTYKLPTGWLDATNSPTVDYVPKSNGAWQFTWVPQSGWLQGNFLWLVTWSSAWSVTTYTLSWLDITAKILYVDVFISAVTNATTGQQITLATPWMITNQFSQTPSAWGQYTMTRNPALWELTANWFVWSQTVSFQVYQYN